MSNYTILRIPATAYDDIRKAIEKVDAETPEVAGNRPYLELFTCREGNVERIRFPRSEVALESLPPIPRCTADVMEVKPCGECENPKREGVCGMEDATRN